MKAETEPIADEEWLLRRIPAVHWLTWRAFEPRLPGKKIRNPDTTGISLYRLACLQCPEDVLAGVDAAKRPSYGIVGIPMSALKTLGFTVLIEPDPLSLGHVVIWELRASLYAVNKASYEPVLVRLAEHAGGNIILAPSKPP